MSISLYTCTVILPVRVVNKYIVLPPPLLPTDDPLHELQEAIDSEGLDLLSCLKPSHLPYQIWLDEWLSLLQSVPARPVFVPQAACPLVTPLRFSAWDHLLLSYPYRNIVHFFLQGIANGFRIGCNTSTIQLKSASRNMQSAITHSDEVEKYLAKKLREGMQGCRPLPTVLFSSGPCQPFWGHP